MDVERRGVFEGIRIAANLNITHLLFVDGILVFCSGSFREAERLSKILILFCKATRMQINVQKSTITTFNLEEESMSTLLVLFPLLHFALDDGIIYLGYRLKPNSYGKEDWNWLLAKLEVRVNSWCNRWLSRPSRLILVKLILEAIPIYLMANS